MFVCLAVPVFSYASHVLALVPSPEKQDEHSCSQLQRRQRQTRMTHEAMAGHHCRTADDDGDEDGDESEQQKKKKKLMWSGKRQGVQVRSGKKKEREAKERRRQRRARDKDKRRAPLTGPEMREHHLQDDHHQDALLFLVQGSKGERRTKRTGERER